jgi:hypothetical protein
LDLVGGGPYLSAMMITGMPASVVRLDLPRGVRHPGPTICRAHHGALRHLLNVIPEFSPVK